MADNLVHRCNEAMRLGLNFETIWHSIIKPNPAVAGIPVQKLDGDHPYLEVPLVRGDWLVIDFEAKKVSQR